jgi:excisionase family DNA binding protein
MPTAELIRTDEAVKSLGVHGATLREWARRGLIEAVRTPGGMWLFPRRVIEELATPTKQQVPPKSAA